MATTTENQVINIDVRMTLPPEMKLLQAALQNATKQTEDLKAKLKIAGSGAGAGFNEATKSVRELNKELLVSQKSAGRMGQIMQNTSYQVTDFVVSIQNGQTAVKAFGQQAPQLLGIFGPWGAAAGLVAAALAGLWTVVTAGESTKKSASESNDALSDSFSALNESSSNLVEGAKQFDLDPIIKQFNEATAAGRRTQAAMIDIQLLQLRANYTLAKEAAKSFNADSFASEYQLVADDFRNLNKTMETLGVESGVASKFMGDLAKSTKDLNANQAFLDKWGKTLAGNINPEVQKLLNVQIELNKTLRESKEAYKEVTEFQEKAVKAGSTGRIQTQKELDDLAKAQERAAKAAKKHAETLAASEFKAYANDIQKFVLDAEELSVIEKTSAQTLRQRYEVLMVLNPEQTKFYENVLLRAEEFQTEQELIKANTKAWQEYYDLIAKSEKLVEEAILAETKAEEQRYAQLEKTLEVMEKDYAKVMKVPVEENIKYYETLDNINQMQEQGLIVGDEATAMWARYAEEVRRANDGMMDMGEITEAVAIGIGEELGSAIDSMIDNFGEAKLSFSDMAESMLKDLAKLITKWLIMDNLMEQIKAYDWGSIFSGSVSASSAAYSAPAAYSSVNLSVPSAPSVSAFNMPILSPQTYSGGSMSQPSNSKGISASPVYVTVNNNSEAVVETTNRQQPDGSTMIDVLVSKRVQEMFSNGSMDRTMRGNFGLVRSGM